MIKSVSSVDIPALLRQVAAGYTLFQAPERALDGLRRRTTDAPALTERELTILASVAAGLTTKAISAELWVSEHTVKFHLTNIYRKLGVSNRSGAVRYAYEHGLVAAGELTPPGRGDGSGRCVAAGQRDAGAARARRRLPARQAQRDRRRPAGAALDDAVPAEQPHALVDAGQPHAPAARRAEQRLLDVEAAAVVHHARADAVRRRRRSRRRPRSLRRPCSRTLFSASPTTLSSAMR